MDEIHQDKVQQALSAFSSIRQLVIIGTRPGGEPGHTTLSVGLDDEWICEQHPWLRWPHSTNREADGQCAGPGILVTALDSLHERSTLISYREWFAFRQLLFAHRRHDKASAEHAAKILGSHVMMPNEAALRRAASEVAVDVEFEGCTVCKGPCQGH